MDQTNSKKLYFPENTSDIIESILKKYNLEETEEEIDEKIFGDNEAPLMGEVVANIVAKLSRKEILENNVSAMLQKELNIPKTTGDSLANDIKVNIMPLATEIKIPILTPLESGRKDMDIFPKTDTTGSIAEKITDDIPAEEKNKILIPSKRIKKLPSDMSIAPPPIQKPSGPDSYREPIE